MMPAARFAAGGLGCAPGGYLHRWTDPVRRLLGMTFVPGEGGDRLTAWRRDFPKRKQLRS